MRERVFYGVCVLSLFASTTGCSPEDPRQYIDLRFGTPTPGTPIEGPPKAEATSTLQSIRALKGEHFMITRLGNKNLLKVSSTRPIWDLLRSRFQDIEEGIVAIESRCNIQGVAVFDRDVLVMVDNPDNCLPELR